MISKTRTFVLALIIFTAAATAVYAADYSETLNRLKETTSLFDDQVSNWNYRDKCDERCFLPELPAKLSWKKAAPGFYWPEPHQVFWFRRAYTVPAQVAGIDVAGSKMTLKMNVSDGGEVYVNGEKAGDAESAVISQSAAPGDTLTIGVRVFNKTYAGAYLGASISYSVFDEPLAEIKRYSDRLESVVALLPFSKDKEKWTAKLNESAALVDLAALDSRDLAAFYKSLAVAENALKKHGEFFKDYTNYMVCYSHIDLAWLWDYDEGEQVTYDTLKTVFGLMDEFPEWIYTHSQAHSVKWMVDDYPEVFAELKKWVDEGRVELVGGTWSEHDSNLPGGEGFVRQFLYGKRYFRDKFGKDIVIGWTPDSFGYNWNLPQILVKSGMTGFLTQKLGMNEFTRFPHKIFWWQGPDGSKILTYFPPSGYANSVDRLSMIHLLAGMKSKHGVNDDLVIYGVGDHGGGLTRGHLERAFALKEDPAYPKIVLTGPEAYFKHLHEEAKTLDFPVWDDELYLEHHRGTYTTQAQTKKNNRMAEQLLETAEKLSVIAVVDHGLPYPAERLFMPGWYYTLLFHMHDILPGSGIRKVYEDCDRDYAKVFAETRSIVGEALGKIAADVNTAGDGEPLLIFNPLSWERDAVIEHPAPGLTEKVAVTDSQGRPVPCQLTNKDGAPHVLFIARALPALGYEVYRVFPTGGAAAAPPASDLSASDGTLENSFLKIEYDSRSGHIKSLFDKKLNREFFETDKNNNELQAFVDTQNAWEIMMDQPIPFDRVGDARIIERGPVRVTVLAKHRLGISEFSQFVSLYEHCPLAEGRMEVQFEERNATVKLAFNLNLLNEDTWFEIPYAAISRKAIPLTQADRAKFEMSGHKWVDYTNQDGAAGISLLNNSKYGFDVKQNVLRMSMLRSPITPDPLADRGFHSVEYALYTHAGDWRAADTSRRGYEYNYKPVVLLPGSHEGPLPARRSYFKSEPDNVALTVVKAGEDDGIIIRFVETEGRAADAAITLPWTPAGIAETNLIEDEIEPSAPWSLNGNTMSVPVGPYEIKTFKIRL